MYRGNLSFSGLLRLFKFMLFWYMVGRGQINKKLEAYTCFVHGCNVCTIRIIRLMVGWLFVGWLVGWLGRWVVGWLGGWVVGWLGGWVVGWLGGWVVGWLGGWVAGWLGGWVAGWLGGWVAGWLGGWLVGWLVGWVHILTSSSHRVTPKITGKESHCKFVNGYMPLPMFFFLNAHCCWMENSAFLSLCCYNYNACYCRQ